MGRKKSPEKQRIEHLENLVEKAASYIDSLEDKLRECEKDRRELVNYYWKVEQLEKERKELVSEIKTLKTSNQALSSLLSEVYRELNELKKNNSSTCASKKTKKAESTSKADVEVNKYTEKHEDNKDTAEIDEFKSELKKIITERLKNQSKINKQKLDIKG